MSPRSLRGLVRVCALAIGLQLLLPIAVAHARDESAQAHDLADADNLTLTLDEALALAAERAPGVEAARARVAEAEARRVQAEVPLRDNPVLDIAAGPRFGEESGTGIVVGAGWSQTFELGGQRGLRIEAAEAGATLAGARAEITTLELQIAVGEAFLEAIAARQRVEIAEVALALTAEVVAVETRRLEAGDASELEVAVASLALERGQAEVAILTAEHTAAVAELRALLGIDADTALTVQGTLEDHLVRFERDALLARVAERPELRALEAEVAEAEALESLGDAMAWPDLGVRLGYELEEGAHAVLGSVAFTLPIFDAGQGPQASAVAQASAARAEAAAVERVASARVDALLETYTGLLAALDDYQTEALELVERTATMARTAYESGAIPLNDLLTLRRELVAARTTHVDLLHSAARVALELRIAAGDLS